MKIVCLCGKSASGKNKISELVQNNFNIKEAISHTTRPRRTGEGDIYKFISIKEFKQMKKDNEFIETRIYNTKEGQWCYGLSKEAIDLNSDNNYLVILDMKGLLSLKDYLIEIGKIDCLTSVYVYTSSQVRLLRSLNREGDMTDKQVTEVVRRFQADEKDFLGIEDYIDYVLINNDEKGLEEAKKLFKSILEDNNETTRINTISSYSNIK